MRIASLDPGFNTGLAIAEIELSATTGYVWLRKYFLGTVVDEPETVASLVLASRSKVCLMEAKPKNAADSAWVPNTKLKVLLGDMEILEIQPGTWKPFMTSRLAVLAPWEPETQHEKDAMAMLFYYIQITYLTRTVVYV